jgi:phage terminase large subunit-like protein
MSAQAERLYTGAAKFPSQAPWVADLRRELCAFPDGRHDDQVDSISHFLEWSRCGLARKRAGEVPLRPIGTRRGW